MAAAVTKKKMGGRAGGSTKNKEQCEETERTFGREMRDCKGPQDVSFHLAGLGTTKASGHMEFLKGLRTFVPRSLIVHSKETDFLE